MERFGESISSILTSVLLLVVYVVGVGGTWLFASVFGKHFLGAKISKAASSYWSDLDLGKKSLEEYYRQF